MGASELGMNPGSNRSDPRDVTWSDVHVTSSQTEESGYFYFDASVLRRKTGFSEMITNPKIGFDCCRPLSKEENMVLKINKRERERDWIKPFNIESFDEPLEPLSRWHKQIKDAFQIANTQRHMSTIVWNCCPLFGLNTCLKRTRRESKLCIIIKQVELFQNHQIRVLKSIDVITCFPKWALVKFSGLIKMFGEIL